MWGISLGDSPKMSKHLSTLRGRIGSVDRAQRLLIGLMLMVLNVVGLLGHPEPLRWVALGIQLELIVTALIGRCPIHWVAGTNTCRLADGR